MSATTWVRRSSTRLQIGRKLGSRGKFSKFAARDLVHSHIDRGTKGFDAVFDLRLSICHRARLSKNKPPKNKLPKNKLR